MYAKVFSQMYDGSLCTQGPWQALVTFQQFLVLADQEGVVDMTAEAIARRTTIPLEIITQGIACLLLPDKQSRTPTEDGRRIVPLSPGRDWGWRVVNYTHYRLLKREADRRDYHRDYWHKRKTQPTQQTQLSQPITEAEAKAKAETKKHPPTSADEAQGYSEPSGFAAFWDAWPKSSRKVARKTCAQKWQKLKLSSQAETILSHIEAMKSTKQWTSGYEPAPLTYLNGERWRDGLPDDSSQLPDSYI
jgi:hypothetical protein